MPPDPSQSTLNWTLIAMVSIWCAAAIVFAFFDLQISIAFVRPDSQWAIFLERYGEYPASYLLITALLTVIVWITLEMRVRLRKPAQRLVVDRYLPQVFRQMAFVTIIMNVVCRLTFVILTKRYWGRVRFKELSDGFEEFTPWYVINGVNGNFSFMSGHAASAWMVLALIVLTRNSSLLKQFLVLAGTISYGVAMAVSRVRLGAHYASDVLFSTGVCVTVFLLALKWLKHRESIQATRGG